jgi:hypothetical protein
VVTKLGVDAIEKRKLSADFYYLYFRLQIISFHMFVRLEIYVLNTWFVLWFGRDAFPYSASVRATGRVINFLFSKFKTALNYVYLLRNWLLKTAYMDTH